MRILVIGGITFMGREIVERLLTRGHEVAVVHRRGSHDLGPRVRNLQADRGDVAAISSVLAAEQPDVVFDMVYDWQTGTPASHVEAAARSCGHGLHRYVFMSSIAAYGPGLNHREGDALVPDNHPNTYAQQKASTERALFRMHEESRFPVTTFRPPFVHGPRQPYYREMFFWDRLIDGRPIILPDGGEQPMQWAYVFDVAEACVRAMEVPQAAGQAFNIAHVQPTTQRGFVEALARAAGVEPRLVAVPRSTIQAAGGQVSSAQLYFGDFLDLPANTEVVEKAQQILGVQPATLDDALAESFTSYRRQPRRPVDYRFEDGVLSML